MMRSHKKENREPERERHHRGGMPSGCFALDHAATVERRVVMRVEL